MTARTANAMKPIRSIVGAAVLLLLGSAHAAKIEIQNRDPLGMGFNDPTPTAPVGGNTGRTLGEQRMNVYKYVADVWSRALDSSVTITVSAGWEPLECNAFGAVLGSASPYNVWYNFPGAPVENTWYPQALANKISQLNLPDYTGQEDDGSGYGNVDIKTQFNSSLGTPGCMAGGGFYLGLDGNAGNLIDFAATLLHELGHGMGFTLLTTNSQDGTRYMGLPSIWESFMYDNTLGKTWLAMDDSERAASAVNDQKLAWFGPYVASATPQVLSLARVPKLSISGAGANSIAGDKPIGEAAFGPALTQQALTGSIVRISDQPITGAGFACNALSAATAAAVTGQIALVDRGGCPFTQKVKNLQQAGAKAVLVADNVVAPINGMTGSDDAITIPSARILKVDGDAIKAALITRVRGKPAPKVFAAMSAGLTGRYAGADDSGRPLLYAPVDYTPGSSVSHWDRSLTPNMLMEPFINSDLTMVLTVPKDLTLPLLKDIGW